MQERTSTQIWRLDLHGARRGPELGLLWSTLHKGQVALGNPMRALLCVGVAYFLVGVIVPVVMLSSQGGFGL